MLYFYPDSYFFFHSAGLFSKNAFIPSFWSSVEKQRANKSFSKAIAESISVCIPLFIASLLYFKAIGAFFAIWAAIAYASLIRASGSTTLLTKPIRYASSAVIGFAV